MKLIWNSYFCIKGGITKFAIQPSTVTKWILSRPFQARFVEVLNVQCGLEHSMCSPNKCLRPNEIRKSNEAKAKLLTVIESYFLSPFDDNLVPENLYNLVSGMPVDESICDCLTLISGERLIRQFISRMQVGGSKESFAHTIKKYPLKNFEDSTVKVKLSKSGVQKEVEIHSQYIDIAIHSP